MEGSKKREEFISSLKTNNNDDDEIRRFIEESEKMKPTIGELAEGYKSILSDLGEVFFVIVENYNECLKIAKRNEIIGDVKLKARIKDFSSSRLNTDKKILDDIFGMELIAPTEEGKEFLMLFNRLAFEIKKEKKHRKEQTGYTAYHCMGDLKINEKKLENLQEKIKKIIASSKTQEYKRSKISKEFDQERDVKDVDIFPYLRKQIEDSQRLDGITSVLEKMLKYILTVETNIDLPIIEFQFKTAEVAENAIRGTSSHSKYKETDERKIRNKLIEGKLIRGVNSPWKFEGTEKGIKLQDFYKTLLENWPFLKDDIIKRRENNEMEDKELFSTYDRLTAEQFPFFRKYIPEYEYDDINKEESWQTLKIAMTSNTLERDEPLKEDVLESKVPKNDEGR